MGSVADILKILDQVPIWKNLKALPARMDEMERRLAAMEEKAGMPKRAPGKPCPGCRALAYRVTKSEKSKGPLGVVGAMDRTYVCGECGFTETKEDDK